MLEALPASESGSTSPAAIHLILDADIVSQVCCYGAVSDLDTVAQPSRQLLRRLLSLREELFWPELRNLLLQWMPYIEVCSCTMVHVLMIMLEKFKREKGLGCKFHESG